MLDKGI